MTIKTDNGAERLFRNTVLTAQTLFGSWFLVHGLNHWIPFFPQPMGGEGPAFEFLTALINSGLFTVVKVIEVIVGALLLAHRFVPLAIVTSLPITLVIVYHNAVLHEMDLFHFVVVSGLIIVNIIIALGYMRNLKGLLAYAAGEPRLSAVQDWLHDPFSSK